jgi:hypothetical protein
MLEIRRGNAARSYENTFFREFSKNLAALFDKYSLDGLLIANSECEAEPKLQIDALLITANTICLIDFKNFEGDIFLPQNDKDFSEGKWVNQSNEIIKGGSSINPYKQLYTQKGRFSWVFHSFIKEQLADSDLATPSHAKKVVCFQKPITLNGSIPGRDEIDFFITDSDGYLETIKDIIDVKDDDISISVNSFSAFSDIFNANVFDVNEQYKSEIIPNCELKTSLNVDNLFPDQKAALEDITEFIQSDDSKVFVLSGTSSSGKSHLISYIEDIAFHNGVKQVELFASSSRIANNLVDEGDKNCNSIYSYIYGGLRQSEDEEVSEEDFEEVSALQLEFVPIKQSDDEDYSIFIVDEAQLVADHYHQSVDLRFGSGKLLEDFINFTNFSDSKRKIIFIGDSFKLSIGKNEESSLCINYLKEKYDISAKEFKLTDKYNDSDINKQAMIAIQGIRSNTFNNLSFDFSDSFGLIDKQDILPEIANRVENNTPFHVLGYSNLDAQNINNWIKSSILKNGKDLSINDLVIFNNNFSVCETNNFFSVNKIFNGQFATVIKVSDNFIDEVVTPKGSKSVTLRFREVEAQIKGKGLVIRFLSLENYRMSDKGELKSDEILALRVLLNTEITKEFKKKSTLSTDLFVQYGEPEKFVKISEEIDQLQRRLGSGEKVKGKLEAKEVELRTLKRKAKKSQRRQIEKTLYQNPDSKFYKYKNAAHIKFGWAMTVHKAMAYKWDEVFFNVEQGQNRGKSNKAYFQWLYSGIVTARERVNLINFESLNPLSKVQISENELNKQPDKKLYLVTERDKAIDDIEHSILAKFGFNEDMPLSTLLQLYKFLEGVFKSNEISITAIGHPNYQEFYEVKGLGGETAKLSFYYNNKGHIKPPCLMQSDPKEFGDNVIDLLTSDRALNNFDFIHDCWRQNVYSKLSKQLKNNSSTIVYIIQDKFHDRLKIVKGNKVIIVDCYFDGNGFYKSIISNYYSDLDFWDEFKIIINELKSSL